MLVQVPSSYRIPNFTSFGKTVLLEPNLSVSLSFFLDSFNVIFKVLFKKGTRKILGKKKVLVYIT